MNLQWHQPTYDSRPNASIAQIIMNSHLMIRYGGFAVFSNMISARALTELQQEAESLFLNANRRESSSRGEIARATLAQDRLARPQQLLFSHSGGPIQEAVFRDIGVFNFVASVCGVRVARSFDRGSYNYYARPGDYFGLHRDDDYCDVAAITVLHDNFPSARAGSLVVYPGRIRDSLTSLRARPEDGDVVVKVKPGQTLILYGGLIAHEVLPVVDGQFRTVSAFCFKVVQ